MTNPTYWPHTAKMSRVTRGNLRDYASLFVLGLPASKLKSADSTILNRQINQVQNRWRLRYPQIRSTGQRQWTLTWVADDTRAELAADFAEFGEGGRVTLLDTSGNEDGQLEIITKEDYEQSYTLSGSNRYDDRHTAVAYLWGVSDNGQRILEVVPTPTTAIQLRIYGVSYLEDLDNDADELEVPVDFHEGVECDVALSFAVFKGNPRWQELQMAVDRVHRVADNPIQDETKRPTRFLSFEEGGGYAALSKAE